MKKFIILFTSLILVLSLTACTSLNLGNSGQNLQNPDETSVSNNNEEAPDIPEVTLPLIENPEGREEQYYSEYLLSGALDAILAESKIDQKSLYLYTYLEDLNGDGIRELWLQATNTIDVAEYLYTIHNGRIVCLTKTLGSVYGNRSRIILVRNTATGAHYPSVETLVHLSAADPVGERTTTIYTIEGGQLTQILTSSMYSAAIDGSADEQINQVKAATSHYTYNENDFRWFMADGEYISADQLAQLDLSYFDYDIRTTRGYYNDPLGLDK